jgi:hypothetical protein
VATNRDLQELHNKTQQDMAAQLMIVDNLPGFKLSQQNFNVPAGERRPFPLLIFLVQLSLGTSAPQKLSYKTAIHLQVISAEFEQLVNQIYASFFVPQIR